MVITQYLCGTGVCVQSVHAMSLTIEDARARECLLDAIRECHGSKVARQTCDFVARKKDKVVKDICHECSCMCLPEHCMAMTLFLTRKSRIGKNCAGEEGAWLADAVATVMAGARIVRGPNASKRTPTQRTSAQNHHDRIRSLVKRIENEASVLLGDEDPASIGAKSDIRFAEALGKLPSKLGDKWSPLLSLIDTAYRHDVVQTPLVKNERFRSLVDEAKQSAYQKEERKSTPESVSVTQPDLVTPSNETDARKKASAGNKVEDPELKFAALWTYDRSRCVHDNDVPIASVKDQDTSRDVRKVVRCDEAAGKSERRKGANNPNGQITCVKVA